MEVRPLDPGDIESCLEVIRTLPEWFGYPGALITIEQALGHQAGFVAQERDSIVGFTTLQRSSRETLEVTYLAVHASYRRSGIGRRLLESVARFAAGIDARFICLLTLGESAESSAYLATVDFYRAVGFVRVKEMKLSDWNGAPALLMLAPTESLFPQGAV